MVLIVNGEEKEFLDNCTIEDMLKSLKIEDKVMAIAVNSKVVKKIQWQEYKPVQNDKLEFLNFVGGG